MARTYKRDSNGRFAGGGGGSSGGGSKRPAAKPVSRGVNRLTRDNAGKITSVGGEGATARGGRLKTAAGNKRATVTAKVSGGRAKGTISKKPRGISDSDKQSMQMAKALRSGKPNPAVDAVRRRQENSASSRRQANSLAKGNLLKTTEADRRNRAQSLATAQRKLSEMERTGSGLNRLSGSNTALLGQRAQVAALSKPLPEFRKPNRSDVVAKNRDALARRRAERQNAKTMSDFRARTSAAAIAQVGKENRSAAKPAAAAARTATPKAAKPAAAPKPAARRKPLTGVNDAVKGNLKGFKGLPVSLRSRSQAAAAQRQRNRKTIKSTEVIGARRGVTQTAGGGQKIRISKGKSEQMNLLTGRADTVTNLKVKAVPTNKGSAPGSKSRRRSFGTMTRKMETPASALGRRRLRVGGIEAARKKATPYNTKKAAKTKATRGKALKFYESQKQGRR